MNNDNLINKEILDFYSSRYSEEDRLLSGMGNIEFDRMKDIILRFLPDKPATIYEIGGGTGRYTCWLTKLGHDVHMFDPVPKHIEKAKSFAEEMGIRIKSLEIGEVRNIQRDDESADVLLMMGPLYHLTEREDRIAALKEAKRLLKKGGVILAVCITAFASTMYGIYNWQFDSDIYLTMCEEEIMEGRHRNPEGHNFFTDAYFHRPDEFRNEIKEAGFRLENLLAVQGPCWIVQEIEEKWKNEKQRETILHLCRLLENEPSLMGFSPHLMAVGIKD